MSSEFGEGDFKKGSPQKRDDDGYETESYHNCTQYVRCAFVEGAGLSYLSASDAIVWARQWMKCEDTSQIPPKGALVFYNYTSRNHN